jgi:hypothetical protein
MPKLQEKPSALKREYPALQNMKILYFFIFLWVIFALLDPDPDPATQINADPDPDPKPWKRILSHVYTVHAVYIYMRLVRKKNAVLLQRM